MADGILKVGQIQTSSGSGTITIGQSGETVTIASGATFTGAATNTPSWRATMSTAQTGNTNNVAKLVAFDTEDFDTDSAYTNTASNYKFTVPTGKAGKYFIGANINIGEEGDNADLQQKRIVIYVNGSGVAEGRDQFSSSVIQGSTNNFIGAFTIQNLSVGDYVQVYGQAYNSNFDLQTSNAEFYGFKLTG
jgi:hypothetical protein